MTVGALPLDGELGTNENVTFLAPWVLSLLMSVPAMGVNPQCFAEPLEPSRTNRSLWFLVVFPHSPVWLLFHSSQAKD